MADQDLRDAIEGACELESAHHSRIQWTLGTWQRRSKDDIEQSHGGNAANLRPRIPSDRILWHTNTFGELLPERDLMAEIRDVARSG